MWGSAGKGNVACHRLRRPAICTGCNPSRRTVQSKGCTLGRVKRKAVASLASVTTCFSATLSSMALARGWLAGNVRARSHFRSLPDGMSNG